MRIIGLFALPLGLAACVSAPVEEPDYALNLSEGAFEVRAYAPTIVAETTVVGDAFGSRFEGFGPLADYIFAKERDGEKIAMTAPVTQHATKSDEWTIGFTMPAGYSMETLPAPASPDVRLTKQPAQTMAVFKFTGIASESDMVDAQRTLMQKVADAGLTAKGEPVFAFYDPPWTLPFMRRNEVMVEVAEAK
jgi:SOUL heme-binding protein